MRHARTRLGTLVALAVAGLAVVWIVIGSGSSGSSSSTSASSVNPVGPVGLSASGLRTLSASVGQPIYWAGPKKGYVYELTRTSNGSVFVRYLPPGTKVGAKEAKYLVIATYPFKDAFQALKNIPNAQPVEVPGGGIALIDGKYPQSVHLAYPSVDYQVEVFDPSPALSLEVARSGDVLPVG